MGEGGIKNGQKIPCTKRDLKFEIVVELAQYTVVRFTRFLFGGFTTESTVFQLDEKLVIAPLCSSKIAKARPHSAEWPKCTLSRAMIHD